MTPGLKRLPEIYAELDANGPMSVKTLANKVGYTGYTSITGLIKTGHLEIVGHMPLDTDLPWKRSRAGKGVPIVRRKVA